MKYGNFDVKIPSTEQYEFALKDLLEKGELTQAEYNSKINKLKKDKLRFIAKSNDSKTLKSNRKRDTIHSYKDQAETAKIKEIKAKIISEELSTEENKD